METVIDIPAEHEANVFGQFDVYAKKIERALHVTLIARGESVKIMGDALKVEKAKKVLDQLVELSKRGNTIQEQNVDYTLALVMEDSEENVLEIDKDIICHTLQGKPIKPKTLGQKKYVDAIRKQMIVFGLGPAGTGKTYLAMAMAITAFKNNEVVFRPGPVYQSAKTGGFCILDEINMARNEALAVLHSVLDFRRTINVPGYEPITVHPAARFIATMNYGYAGTRDLNEALASRFVIIHMPEITEENLMKLLLREFPDMKKSFAAQFAGLFTDIQLKCQGGELTEKVLDLRGLLDAVRMIHNGLAPYAALDMGLTNKTFDVYEQTLIKDIITSRISKKTGSESIFI